MINRINKLGEGLVQKYQNFPVLILIVANLIVIPFILLITANHGMKIINIIIMPGMR